MTTASVLDRTARDFRPGFLLQPLGWLNQKLANTHGPNRGLTVSLLELEPCRMHLIATVVALAGDESAHQMARLLLCGSAKNIRYKEILGQYPPGLSRALKSLPLAVMPPESYRQLVELLNDSETAKFLHHRRSIDKSIITGLSALPPVLRRPAIFKLYEEVEGMDRFVEGLRFLSTRAGLRLEAMMGVLGSFNQVEQVIAKIVELAEGVPLPDVLPKGVVGSFRRMDSVAEIRTLAKAWRNCLADYLHAVNDGTCAIYLSAHGNLSAVAFISRVDRLGWALDQITGPKNTDIESNEELGYRKAFIDAGIPPLGDIASIKDLILRGRWSRRRGD